MQLYFWVFVVAVLIFGLGAVFSLLEGIHKLRNPEPVEHAYVNYIVLGVSMVFEIGSWTVAYREFNRQRADHGLFQRRAAARTRPCSRCCSRIPQR